MKTFLTAIFCVTRAILYPESKIIAAAGLKSQSREVIQKIDDLRKTSPLLEREISDIKTSVNDSRVEFHNGSWIRTVASNDGARGARSNVLIIDEFRMVSEDVINTVLRKFQTASRSPKYLSKPEYKHLPLERNKEIYLSSAYFKNHHSYERVDAYKEAMTDGKSYFVCSLPYQISIKESLLNRDQVEDEMSEKNFSEISWYMEMDSLFFGSTASSFFDFEELQKNRKLNRAYYPKEITELLNDRSLAVPKKENGEVRVVSADIATMAGSQNDASVFTVGRLIPTKSGYDRHIVYMESMEGAHTTAQSMRLRQLMEDFSADTLVLDTQNAGIGVYDQLTQHATDPERGTEYLPMSCMNDERLAERCVYPNAPKNIYSIRGSAQLNSDIASNFKDSLTQGRIRFPIDENQADETLSSIRGYDSLPPDVKVDFKMPFIQTTLMVNEILNLESEVSDAGLIRLKESGRARKDRFSSVSYLDYYATELGIKNRKRPTEQKSSQMFMMKRPSPY